MRRRTRSPRRQCLCRRQVPNVVSTRRGGSGTGCAICIYVGDHARGLRRPAPRAPAAAVRQPPGRATCTARMNMESAAARAPRLLRDALGVLQREQSAPPSAAGPRNAGWALWARGARREFRHPARPARPCPPLASPGPPSRAGRGGAASARPRSRTSATDVPAIVFIGGSLGCSLWDAAGGWPAGRPDDGHGDGRFRGLSRVSNSTTDLYDNHARIVQSGDAGAGRGEIKTVMRNAPWP